jgi:hypothetical protein
LPGGLFHLDASGARCNIACNDPEMITRANSAPHHGLALTSELGGLLDQIGSPAKLDVGDVFNFVASLKSFEKFRQFLNNYESLVLTPIELPTIFEAHHHTARYECREVIALDRRLGEESHLKSFARVSQQVGQLQLKRLRPLREHRVVQRYLTALEAGEAFGWHTVVYGISLALFSTPLRQGLAAYSGQVFATFLNSAEHRWPDAKEQLALLDEEYAGRVTRSIDALVAAREVGLFRAA